MNVALDRGASPDHGAGSGQTPLNLRPLEKVQKTLSLATGLSLAVCTSGHSVVGAYSHPEDKIHPLMLTRPGLLCEMLPDLASHSTDEHPFQVVSGPGRLSFLVHPVLLDDRAVSWVVGGPVWETPPGKADKEALAELLDISVAEVEAAVRSHPAPVPLDMARFRDMLVSFAELTAQMLQDQVQQQRNLVTLTALYEVGVAISSTIVLEEVLRKVLERAITLLEAENGSLMLLDEVRSELKMLVAQGLDEQIVTTTRVNLGEGISGWVAQEGQPRLLKKGVRAEGSRSRRPESEMESAMCVPLKVKDRCVGVLNLSGRRDGGDFADDDLKILTILASHAASAIDNAQLYEQVERQVSELQALHQMGRILNSSLSLEEILPDVLDHALALLEAETASVMLLDEAAGELEIRMARGLSEEVVRRTRVKLGERISGKVASSGQPMLFAKTDGDEGDSALCVPLMTNDKVVGVLNIRNKKNGCDFSQADLELATRLANVAALSIANAGLHDELQQLFVNSIRALANAIDARDPYTSGHSERVTSYAVMIAGDMGFEGDELEDLRYASLLHDIGKIRIRDHILHKPGRLTEEEFDEMKRHPEYGVEIMKPVIAFQKILPYMLYHHERFDGRGYPEGLAGNDIPQQARIMCVADCFDAMTSDRPYRRGMPIEQAVAELKKNVGTQFDPVPVGVFVKLVEAGKVRPIVEQQASRKNAFPDGLSPVDSPWGMPKHPARPLLPVAKKP